MHSSYSQTLLGSLNFWGLLEGTHLLSLMLFFGTIAENIAYGMPQASREEIVAAARAAHAHEFIMRLPQGYDSLVGERGQGLSGGERQRLALARALTVDPEVLLLDEPTSSLDDASATAVDRVIRTLVESGLTVVLVSHDLDRVQGVADFVLVLEKGRLVERGSPEQVRYLL